MPISAEKISEKEMVKANMPVSWNPGQAERRLTLVDRRRPDVIPPTASTARENFQTGTVVVPLLPNELGYILRKHELEILCQGDAINVSKNSGSSFFSFFSAAALCLIGILAEIGWDSAVRQKWFVVLLILTVGSGSAAAAFYREYYRAVKNSPYSRLVKRLQAHFAEKPEPSEPLSQ